VCARLARSIESRRLSARAIEASTRKVAKYLAGRAATGISVGQAFQPDKLMGQAGKPDLLSRSKIGRGNWPDRPTCAMLE
jgi:hypothetical protein